MIAQKTCSGQNNNFLNKLVVYSGVSLFLYFLVVLQ